MRAALDERPGTYVVVGPPGSGVSHAVNQIAARLRLSGLEAGAAQPWFPLDRTIEHPDGTDASADVVAALDDQLATLPAGDGQTYDIAVDDAHLLTAVELDVIAELATRHRVVLGMHPGEGIADEVVARFSQIPPVAPSPLSDGELRSMLSSLAVPADQHDELVQRSSGLPGVARALALGGVLRSAMQGRYRALAGQLDEASVLWIALSELAPTESDRALLAPPPKQLISLRLVVPGTNRCRITALTEVVMELSADRLDDVRLQLAEIIADPISRAMLLRDGGHLEAAAALASEHATREPDPDRRASLLTLGATDLFGRLLAAEALLQRERPQEARALLEDPHTDSTAADSTAADSVAPSRLLIAQAQAARQLELADRWTLVEELSPETPGDERRRQLQWFAGHPLPPPPMRRTVPHPDGTVDLDAARWEWHRSLLGLIDAPIAERAERQVEWKAACRETLEGGSTWRTTFDQFEALMQLSAAGPVMGVGALGTTSVRPSLPRALVEACQMLAWADAGASNKSLAQTPTSIPTAPIERSLWAWARAEAELAAGHPLAALRVAHDAAPFRGTAAVFARTCAAWAALDVGEPIVAPSPDESAGWVIKTSIEETCAVAEFSRLLAADELESGAAEIVSKEFARLAGVWEGWLVRAELRCRWAAGEAARLAGSFDAIEQLRAAEQQAQDAGLAPLLQRIRRSLRLAGVRRTGRRTSSSGPLSARELEVIALVGKGLSTRAIATQLGISPATVETQVASVMAKFGVRSRLQAALQAQKLSQ